MKKKLLMAVLVAVSCGVLGAGKASAQSTSFSYDDHNGVPNAGTYSPGSSFSFSINLGFTPGGVMNNLEGLSYWFQQNGAGPYYFSITLRDITGSPFTDLQTPSLSYPQTLAPSNTKDLGALIPTDNTPLGAGTYFVANLTISIDPSAPIGVYTIQNVTSGGRTSFIFNSQGTGFAIPASTYTITVVPEPSTLALGGVGLAGLLALALRRRRA